MSRNIFLLPHVTNVEFIKEGPRMTTESTGVKGDGIVVVVLRLYQWFES